MFKSRSFPVIFTNAASILSTEVPLINPRQYICQALFCFEQYLVIVIRVKAFIITPLDLWYLGVYDRDKFR